MQVNSLEREAHIFCKYLTGKKANDQAVELYIRANESKPLQYSKKDYRILNFIKIFPFFIGFIDAAMAFFAKESVARKKIFIMLAILETLPDYSKYFLAQKHSVFYLVVIAFRAFRAVYRLIAGTFLLKLI